MGIQAVKFNKEDRPDFFQALRTRVNAHFKDNKISKYATANMKFKSIFMMSLYFVPMILLYTGVITSIGLMFGMWFLMGLGMAGIGLCIMHDANHGAYSKNKTINNMLGFLVNFLGSYHINWKIQHNVLHHSFTNIHGMDEDIDNAIMRFSPNRPGSKKFKLQSFYGPFVYLLLSLYKFASKDIEQLIRFNRNDLYSAQGLTFKQAKTQLIFHKIWYIGMILVLPIIVMSAPWWVVVLGFILMQFVCGVILALVFQAAHVLEETTFSVPDSDGNVESNWAIHQMETTANFAHGGRIFSWFIGGLNYQIEHHLFPNICHVHYRDLSVIVKETAKEYGVPYITFPSFYSALKSHFKFLHKLGKHDYNPGMAA